MYTYAHVYQHVLFLLLFHKHSINTITDHMHSLRCLAVTLNRERREQLAWQKTSGAPNKTNQECCTGKDQWSVMQSFLYSNEIKTKCPGVSSLCVLTVPLCSKVVYHRMVMLWTKNLSRRWTILPVLQSFLCTSSARQGQYTQIVVDVPLSPPQKDMGSYGENMGKLQKKTRILTNTYLLFSSNDQVSYFVKYVYS